MVKVLPSLVINDKHGRLRTPDEPRATFLYTAPSVRLLARKSLVLHLTGEQGLMILKRQERGDISDYSLATPLDFLVQGIQQLQQVQLRRDGHEPELPEGSLDLPKLSGQQRRSVFGVGLLR